MLTNEIRATECIKLQGTKEEIREKIKFLKEKIIADIFEKEKKYCRCEERIKKFAVLDKSDPTRKILEWKLYFILTISDRPFMNLNGHIMKREGETR